MLIAAGVLAVLLAVFGVPVADKLSPSGFADPTAESSRAARFLTDKFGQGDVPLVIVVAAMADLQITDQFKRDLLILKAVAVPLSFPVLTWVFGGLFAALPRAFAGIVNQLAH